MNPFQSLIPYVLKIRVDIALGLQRGLFVSRSPHKILYTFLITLTIFLRLETMKFLINPLNTELNPICQYK